MQLRAILLKRLDQLPEIVRDWHVDLSHEDQARLDQDPRLVLEGVYNQLRDSRRAGLAVNALDEMTRSFLQFLAILGGEAPARFLLRKGFDGDLKMFNHVVDRAAGRHLVFITVGDEVHGHPFPDDVLTRNGAFVGIPDPYLRYIELPEDLPASMAQILKEMSSAERKQWIKALGLPERKRANIEEIWDLYASLTERMPSSEEVTSLPPLARQIARILGNNPRTAEEDLIAYFHSVAPDGAATGPLSDEEVLAAVDELLSVPYCFAVPSARLFSRHDLVVPLEWRSHDVIDGLIEGKIADEEETSESPKAVTAGDTHETIDAHGSGEIDPEWLLTFYESNQRAASLDEPFEVEQLRDGVPSWVFVPPVSAPDHVRYADKLKFAYDRVRKSLDPERSN